MKLFEKLWDRFLAIPAPLDTPLSPPLVQPGLQQDLFPASRGDIEQRYQTDFRLATAYRKLVTANNANITRNYGQGDVEITNDTRVPLLTEEDMTYLAQGRAEVKFAAPEEPHAAHSV